jgi:shikimate dehydrogenase
MTHPRIDGETKLMGLIGERISYTRSPAMHNRAAAELGVNAVYLPLSLPAARVSSFLDTAWDLGALGFNVTQPHKTLVAGLFKGCGMASVNTLYRGESGWIPASTDGEGYARGLSRTGRELTSFARIVILGAGGAVRAILASLGAKTGTEITILRRTAANDPVLKDCVPAGITLAFAPATPEALTAALKDRGDDTLFIQATSAPHQGDDLANFVPALRSFTGVVSDIVYGSPSTLYFSALAKNLVAQDGESMLIEQARLAQTLWWGKAAAYDAMAAALRGKLTARR